MSENIIILIILVIVAFLIIRYMTKIILKIIGILVLLAVGAYFALFWKGGLAGLSGDQFILYELEEKYCKNEKDIATCDCIIQPIKSDIEKKYNKADIEAMASNDAKSLLVLTTSLNKNRNEISQCLKSKKSPDKLKLFLDELKKRKK